jgi:hypothetical protein
MALTSGGEKHPYEIEEISTKAYFQGWRNDSSGGVPD